MKKRKEGRPVAKFTAYAVFDQNQMLTWTIAFSAEWAWERYAKPQLTVNDYELKAGVCTHHSGPSRNEDCYIERTVKQSSIDPIIQRAVASGYSVRRVMLEARSYPNQKDGLSMFAI